MVKIDAFIKKPSSKQTKSCYNCHPHQKIYKYLEKWHLNNQQLTIVHRMFHYFYNMKQLSNKYCVCTDKKYSTPANQTFMYKQAPLLLLTGAPGTGKHYTIHTICKIAEEMKIKSVLKWSCKDLMKYAAYQPNINDMVKNLRNKCNCEQLCTLIIDNISSKDVNILYQLHLILCSIIGSSHLPFGGTAVILIGKKDIIPNAAYQQDTDQSRIIETSKIPLNSHNFLDTLINIDLTHKCRSCYL